MIDNGKKWGRRPPIQASAFFFRHIYWLLKYFPQKNVPQYAVKR